MKSLLLRLKKNKRNLLEISDERSAAVPRGRMLSMSVAGDDELECLDVDEDEPVSKSARKTEKSCENVSNKAITHSSDQMKGMNSIIKGQNETHKRELTESSTIKAESIAIDKDTPNNLVDTISRLQRSLSKS